MSLPPGGPQRDPMGPRAVKGGPPVGAARDGAERCPDPGLGSREVHAPPLVPHHLTLSSQAAGPLEDSFPKPDTNTSPSISPRPNPNPTLTLTLTLAQTQA